MKYKDLTDRVAREPSIAIRERVNRAREAQLVRFAGMPFFCNAQMRASDLRLHCQIEAGGERLLELAINRLGLSARAYTRILKVSRTIADLDGAARDRRASCQRGDSVSIARSRRALNRKRSGRLD